MHSSSLSNNALQEFTLIKMIIARFVGSMGSLIRHSTGQMKHIANERTSSIIIPLIKKM